MVEITSLNIQITSIIVSNQVNRYSLVIFKRLRNYSYQLTSEVCKSVAVQVISQQIKRVIKQWHASRSRDWSRGEYALLRHHWFEQLYKGNGSAIPIIIVIYFLYWKFYLKEDQLDRMLFVGFSCRLTICHFFKMYLWPFIKMYLGLS